MMPLLRPVPLRWTLGQAQVGPVRVRLSEGTVSAPRLSAGSFSSQIDAAIASLGTELEALIVELDLVSPTSLRVDPAAASDIQYIGNLPPLEIRSAISVAATELGNRATRMQGGALAAYLGDGQKAQLEALKSKAQNVVLAVQNLDTAPISPGDQDAVNAYLARHVSPVDRAIGDAEKNVVSQEAGSVPVIEPSEKAATATKIAIGVGLVVVTGLVLWHLSG
jgi:hypothetical protein